MDNSFQLWPILAKTKIDDWASKVYGDPTLERYFHKSLEEGRKRQNSIAEANTWIMKEKQKILEHIQHLFNYTKLATDGKLDNPARAIKYGYNIIKFMQQVAAFQANVVKLIQALQQNIGILLSMEANTLSMVQGCLSSLATLLHEICNWGLPSLPSIPNLFSGLWNWNGFNFQSFVPQLSFDFSFAFNQCMVNLPGINVLSDYPNSISLPSGLTFGNSVFIPPLGGLIPPLGQSLSDPGFVGSMELNTFQPYFTGDPTYPNAFNLQSSLQGSLPNPSVIISNYQMPPAIYQANIVSAVPSLVPDVIGQVSPVALAKDLAQFINLGTVVSSNYDPNITAAWLFYMSGGRGTSGGRAGAWLPNFQGAYQTFLQPSVDYLAATPVPWNGYAALAAWAANPNLTPLPAPSAGPAAIPMIGTLDSMPPYDLGNTLWKLSYIEASILGYPRNTTWDGFANPNYTGSFTGADLDYAFLVIDPASTSTVTLGEGTAEYPVSCVFPTAIGKNLQAAIALATSNIQADTDFQSSHPQYRYTYDQFAIASQVDRFSQFWREFNGNLQALLVQDPYLVGFVCAYPESLDSAIDPLGDPMDYNAIASDVASRNRSWVPGTPVLPIQPVLVVSTAPNLTSPSGWSNLSNVPSLDPQVYLSRPDIQAQPVPVQMAMLSLNLSAARLMSYRSDYQTEVQTAVFLAQQQSQTAGNFGFQVEAVNDTTPVPTGITGALVDFDQVDFDLTGYVTSPGTFTVRASGAYIISGQIVWNATALGTYTVTVYDGATAILTDSSPANSSGTVTVPFSDTANLTLGDILTVVATQNSGFTQDVVPGSILTVIMYQSTPDTTPVVPPTSNGTQTFLAGADMVALTAVQVNGSGQVVPVDPTAVPQNASSLSPPFGYDVYPYIDGITLAAVTTGNPVLVLIGYGSTYQLLGAGFSQGGLFYAGPGSASPPVNTGALTQGFEQNILTSCRWVIVAGRALDDQTIVYEPHIPNRVVMSF